MLFGQCPHGDGDKLKGASLKECGGIVFKIIKSRSVLFADSKTIIIIIPICLIGVIL